MRQEYALIKEMLFWLHLHYLSRRDSSWRNGWSSVFHHIKNLLEYKRNKHFVEASS